MTNISFSVAWEKVNCGVVEFLQSRLVYSYIPIICHHLERPNLEFSWKLNEIYCQGLTYGSMKELNKDRKLICGNPKFM